jgi:hypothetical protein
MISCVTLGAGWWAAQKLRLLCWVWGGGWECTLGLWVPPHNEKPLYTHIAGGMFRERRASAAKACEHYATVLCVCMPVTSSRTRLTQPRRPSCSVSSDVPGASAAAPAAAPARGASGEALESAAQPAPDNESSTLSLIARALWLPSYSALFDAELEHNRRLIGRSGSTLAPSSYRARLKGERAAAYDAKMRRRERDQLANELHANNMRFWSPSLVARSVAYVNLTSTWQHSVESGQARLASRPTNLKVLRLMRDCRPPTSWEQGLHVFAYAFDQTYEWVGVQKRGRRQALEHVDARGMPMAIEHEVYVNSIKIHLPASIGTLSPADIATIQNNHGSAYTEDYNNLFDFLRVSAFSQLARPPFSINVSSTYPALFLPATTFAAAGS